MKFIWITLIPLFTLVSCSTYKSVENSDWENLRETWVVKGREEFSVAKKISLGEYSVQFRSGLNDNKSGFLKLNQVAGKPRQQYFSFALRSRWGLVSRVTAIRSIYFQQPGSNNYSGNLITLISNVPAGLPQMNGPYFAAEINRDIESTPWYLVVSKQKADSRPFKGFLVLDGDNYYTIGPLLTRIKNKTTGPFDQYGFDFRNRAGQVVAMIAYNKKVVVIMGHVGEEEKFLLANACAAMLLEEFSE